MTLEQFDQNYGVGLFRYFVC